MNLSFSMILLGLAGVVVLGLAACADMGYYTQCARGHLDVINRRQPIEALVRSDTTPAALKAKLGRVLLLRDFASRELGLPDNGSYRCYADLERPYVVWNVVAAPEFSLIPKEWCFPVAGCVSYRGYYSQAAAETFAQSLRDQGYDVTLYGVSAYSTLGWFDDPVLNTFLDRPEAQMAALIFHELAHQRVYAKNDSAFNEAFAKTVELEGVARWLRLEGEGERSVDDLPQSEREEAFVALLRETRTELEALFSSSLPEDEMRGAKGAVFHRLKERYAQLKAGWGGYAGYDRWFEDDLNNAKLVSVSTYRRHVPAFQELLARQGGDLAAFYQAVEHLGKLKPAARNAQLEALRQQALAQAQDTL